MYININIYLYKTTYVLDIKHTRIKIYSSDQLHRIKRILCYLLHYIYVYTFYTQFWCSSDVPIDVF